MRRIIALASLSALATLSVPALAASTAAASVSVAGPSCESGLSTSTCSSGAPNPPSTLTWTLDGSSFSGSHGIKFGCEPGHLDSVSFSYVLSGVTYVSNTTYILCQQCPYSYVSRGPFSLGRHPATPGLPARPDASCPGQQRQRAGSH